MFDHLSTGAADDVTKDTDIARSMILRYGMAGDLGSVVYEGEPTPMPDPIQAGLPRRNYSEETARETDCAVRELIDGPIADAEKRSGGGRAPFPVNSAIPAKKYGGARRYRTGSRPQAGARA